MRSDQNKFSLKRDDLSNKVVGGTFLWKWKCYCHYTEISMLSVVETVYISSLGSLWLQYLALCLSHRKCSRDIKEWWQIKIPMSGTCRKTGLGST